MASASSRSLQLGVRRCCAAATTTTSSSTQAARTAATARKQLSPAARLRSFSTTARRGAEDGKPKRLSAKDRMEPWQLEMLRRDKEAEKPMSFAEMMPADENGVIEKLDNAARIEGDRALADMWVTMAAARRPERKMRDMFWNDEESEPEMVIKDGPEEDSVDDMTSMAHGKLDEIRDQRHLARIIAWEMPLLAKFAKPFEPPTAEQPLRFRFTSYMGEFHPAEKKVVVEFCPADLDLTPVQQNKLKKLAGVRYNPEKEIVRMSCEMFEHQAQNKRYLGDLVDQLIVEAKDPTDTFEDIPLDTRHHKFKYKPKFPREWRMSDERRKELQAIRAQSFQLDQKMVAEGTLVDGTQRVQAALAAPTQASVSDKVAELVRLRPSGGQTPLRR